jgi:protein-S-isoprenylcysteine O-methyltransferase Ste14
VTDQADRPGIIAPPLLLTVLCILAALGAQRFVRLQLLVGSATARLAVSAAVFAAACLILLDALRQMRRHRTTPNPYRPSSAIVSSGIYGFTRNPIYVAFLLVVLAAVVGANTGWMLVALVVLFLLLEFGVVRREERYLAAKFGRDYDDYRARVRRWL